VCKNRYGLLHPKVVAEHCMTLPVFVDDKDDRLPGDAFDFRVQRRASR